MNVCLIYNFNLFTWLSSVKHLHSITTEGELKFVYEVEEIGNLAAEYESFHKRKSHCLLLFNIGASTGLLYWPDSTINGHRHSEGTLNSNEDFKVGSGWLHYFMTKNGLPIRKHVYLQLFKECFWGKIISLSETYN